MWTEVQREVDKNENVKPVELRRRLLGVLRESGLEPNGGATKKMVAFRAAPGTNLVWELSGKAQNFFVSDEWAESLEFASIAYERRPFVPGEKDGKRHSGLNRQWSFPGADCLCINIEDESGLNSLLSVLQNHFSESGLFSRSEIENAMDAYDRYQKSHEHSDVFDKFGEPRDYWVLSSRQRTDPVYPTKPLVGFLRNRPDVNGGWSKKDSAASQLNNAGFVVVDKSGTPVAVPKDLEFLIAGAERIRRCALNYFLEPAREQGANEVSIRAGDVAALMGLRDALPNICQALGGKRFQKLARVPAPTLTGPNPGSSTTFTYSLRPETERSVAHREVRALAQQAINRIFYGPPGTGKTFCTANEAVLLCDGTLPLPTAGTSQKDVREAVVRRYRELMTEGRIEFVTFHQSFSYEEFVEGLRPETNEDSGGGFRLVPRSGVFKRIAKRATELGAISDSSVKPGDVSVFKMSLGRANTESDAYLFDECLDGGYVLLGWGGDVDWSDPSFERYEAIKERWLEDEPETNGNNPNIVQLYSLRGAMKEGDLVIVSNGNTRFRAIGRVTGPYEFVDREDGYRHRRKVEWLWSDFDGGLPREEIYRRGFSQQSAYRLADEAINWGSLNALVSDDEDSKAQRLPHVLIIDEINRGNISKILGELITLLEPDKRIGEPNELRTRLPYSGELFGVPSNLHVIGTMNTADRSIALLDTALRRRFEFVELQPDPGCVPEFAGDVPLRRVFETLNDRIEQLFDRDHTIGHAYLMHCQSRDDLDRVMRERVIPLLVEYFYEDWEKVRQVLGEREDDGSFLIRRPLNALPEGSGSYGETRYRYQVKPNFARNAYEQLVA